MVIGGVETNIENQEQYEELIKRMLEWFVNLQYPGWRVKNIRRKVVENDTGKEPDRAAV